MLPNHRRWWSPEFALLEAVHPNRIDLGIGRAPGTDQMTRYALRQGAGGEDPVAEFPRYVDDIGVLMSQQGAAMAFQGREHPLKATPKAASVAPIWLLGSSDYSARLAASRGLPYVFAHHFSGQGTAEALELYRATYQPSERFAEPRTFLTVNACVAETEDEARRLARPQVLQMLAIVTGGTLTPQALVEEAEAVELDAGQQRIADGMMNRWVIGDPESSRRRIAELAAQFGVDEVMVHPVAGSYAGTPADATPAREETLRLLAG